MVREIPLTRGYVALVDDEDYGLAMVHKWHAIVSGRTVYASTAVRVAVNRQKQLSMHGALTGWAMVDHINHDGLDNRRDNLRPCSKAENSWNSQLRSGSETGFKGVRVLRDYPARVVRYEAPGRRRGDRMIWNDGGSALDRVSRTTTTRMRAVPLGPPVVRPGYWTAWIRRRRIGVFNSPEAAARAYDAAARKMFGEFAWLNFPDEEPSTAIRVLT